MKNPEFIIHKFFIHYNPYEHSYMYTELKDGRYAKTYNNNSQVISEYISYEEYTAALAHLILNNKNPQ